MDEGEGRVVVFRDQEQGGQEGGESAHQRAHKVPVERRPVLITCSTINIVVNAFHENRENQEKK
jgi:hypothetical protein